MRALFHSMLLFTNCLPSAYGQKCDRLQNFAEAVPKSKLPRGHPSVAPPMNQSTWLFLGEHNSIPFPVATSASREAIVVPSINFNARMDSWQSSVSKIEQICIELRIRTGSCDDSGSHGSTDEYSDYGCSFAAAPVAATNEEREGWESFDCRIQADCNAFGRCWFCFARGFPEAAE